MIRHSSSRRATDTPIILITARMSSQRLPGKAMATLNGDPLLAHVVSAVAQASTANDFAVVTSRTESDLPIVDWCESHGVKYFRGPLFDVAERMISAANWFGFESFVRISGDSPLIDPQIVAAATELFKESPCDLVTNVHPRTFPPGQSVEVIRSVTLRGLLDSGQISGSDLEHVTPVLYRHAEQLRVRHLEPRQVGGIAIGGDLPSMTVDTWEDLKRVQLVLDRLGGTRAWEAGWQRCAALMLDVDTATRLTATED